MAGLTPKQKAILDFIEKFIEAHEYAPSYREIAAQFKLSSVATVAQHIEALQRKRFLHKEAMMARSIEPLPRHGNAIIPLAGTIAAGEPIEAIQTHETIQIPPDLAGPDVFALRVRGDSMIEEGIQDGDYIIVEPTDAARNGQIVVALLDGERATVKKFYKEPGRVRLAPANRKLKPLYSRNVIIQGRVRGVLRKFI